MSWQLVAGRGPVRWAKYIDREAAMAHWRVLRSEISRADNSTLMAPMPPLREMLNGLGAPMSNEELDTWVANRAATQRQRVRDLAETLRGFGLGCDLVIQALAPYGAARLTGDAGESDYPGLYANAGEWRRDVLSLLSTANADVRDALASGGDLLLDLWPRVDFDAAGATRVLDEPPDPESGSDRREGKTRAEYWEPWTGYVVKTWVPGALAASSRVECSVLLPLSKSWELLLKVATKVVEWGLDATMAASQVWVATRNARLSRVLGGTGLPSTIVNASAEADVAALGNGEMPPIVTQLMGAVTAVLAAVNPIAGVVAALVVGLVSVLYRIIPIATAYAIDVWGRRQPFLERIDHTGKIADHTPPTHAVPPPLRVVAPNPGEETETGEVPDEEPPPTTAPQKQSLGGLLTKGVGAYLLGRAVLG